MTKPAPSKRTLRAFSSTPIAAAFASRQTRFWLAFGFVCPIASGRIFGWGTPFALAFLPLLTLLVLVAWSAWRPERRFANAVREVHAELPWFTASLLEWVSKDRMSPLREALLRNGFVVHEIDAGRVRSFDELLTALGAAFGTKTIPADPVARVVAVVADGARRRGGAHAVLWHGASDLAGGSPETWTRFTEQWSRLANDHGQTVLWLLERP